MTEAEEILLLRAENRRLKQEVLSLKQLLQETLDKLNKTSQNSSKPPSSDIVRTKSLRKKSGKGVGAQQGHQGVTLQMSATPDKIIMHRISHCCGCGKDISGIGTQHYSRRQVYDIPPLSIQVTEHRSEIKCCPHCQAENRGCYPPEVTQPVQYGSNVKQLGVYLSQYQLLPYGRTAQVIEDITGHRLSEGTLANFNTQCHEGLSDFIIELKTHLKSLPVVHSDETGYYFSGKRHWLHVAAGKDATYYYAHKKRGSDAINDMGILPDYKGVLMHDFWQSYLDYDCTHALCNVHHLRDLTFCAEQENSRWAHQMKDWLLNMKQHVDAAQAKGAGSLSPAILQQSLNRFDHLLSIGNREHPPPEKPTGKRGKIKKSKSRNLLERFTTHKEDIVRFIKNFSIPFGNNLAEQAIRMMKLKQKISGCFRSKAGAEVFANIRSYIDTMRKNGFGIMEALARAVKRNPIIPFYTYPHYKPAE